MQMPVLYLRVFKSRMITLLLFIIVLRYLNSSTDSKGLKLVLLLGGLLTVVGSADKIRIKDELIRN